MREALEAAWKVIKSMGGYWASQTLPIIDAALAAPPRNCDVGTAEGQEGRFMRYCNSHYRPNEVDAECRDCLLSSHRITCEFAWAQMPYEEKKR